MTQHEKGGGGFSVDDLTRDREWFTPELYALLVRDKSYTDGVGYLNFDPFTKAQDDVSPVRYKNVTHGGDTVFAHFSYVGYGARHYDVVLAMSQVGGTWRIANFIYPDTIPGDRGLANGLVKEYEASAQRKAKPNSPGQ